MIKKQIQNNKRKSVYFILCCFTLVFQLLVGKEALAISFNISTTSLTGQTGQVAFDFIDGGSPDNSFIISNFDFGIGSSIISTSLIGGVSGDVSSTILFADSDFFNELLVSLTFGNKISFDIVTATNLSPGGSSFPDAFSIFLLDETGQVLINTFDPTGADSLFRWDSGSSPTANIYSPIVSSVPEPGIILFLLVGIPIIMYSARSKKGRLSNAY
ncbi:hypothetical protein Nit79A3_1114 [Nitrosomonas sp. Is79A3]|uniref:NF038129 family PEP-CTERM protein n=1 Tax=Nitrosomonas sp. (strain Is79A3) TaxID=261292 RepID=UPI000215C9D2